MTIAFTAHILTKLTIVRHRVNNSYAEFYKNPSNGLFAGTRSRLGVVSTYDAPFFYFVKNDYKPNFKKLNLNCGTGIAQ